MPESKHTPGITWVVMPDPEPPNRNTGIYLGDGAYVLPDAPHNCDNWIIHTERKNGVNFIGLGEGEMQRLIEIYNETRKPE